MGKCKSLHLDSDRLWYTLRDAFYGRIFRRRFDHGCTVLAPESKRKQSKEKPMRKLIPICIAVALAIALLGTHYHVRAEERYVVGSPILGQRLPNLPPAVNHKLTHSYVDVGAPSASDGSGFTAIDSPVTINCG